jgi:spore maturation protein CgeB
MLQRQPRLARARRPKQKAPPGMRFAVGAPASLRFTVFGLTLSSSWGNGHATTWRGLLRALHRASHDITFFERDLPYYAAARDLGSPDCCSLVIYDDWPATEQRARAAIRDADVAIVSSYCADGLAASRLVLDSDGPLHVFYDIDTPITFRDLERFGVAAARGPHYIDTRLVPEFDLYLSFTGGPLLREIQTRWGARRTAPLYCSVDPEAHWPVPPVDDFRSALGYLGTYSADRQMALDRLLLEPARRRPDRRFFVAGAQYPENVTWPPNVIRRDHLAPAEHPAFYCSSRLTLNVTREAMVKTGYSPSVRLFEAASCGTPILSDWWPGLDEFFAPGSEILLARDSDEAEAALDCDDAELRRIAAAARQRTLAEHTCHVRSQQLIRACEQAYASQSLNATANT